MKIILFIVLALSAIDLSSQRPHGEQSNQGSKNERDFDYLALRQIWPKTNCLFPQGHSCVIADNVNTWVVHGLWPDYYSGYPSFCDPNMKFDPSQIKDLMPSLNQYWPNLFTDEELTSFWEHEWEKHGTCALSIIKDEHAYFETTLGLHDKFDFTAILAKNGIVPSDSKSYSIDEIQDAIASELKYKPLVTCEAQGQKQFISEMQICLDKNLELLDCFDPKMSNSRNSAGSCKGPVVYPIIH